MIYFSTAPTGDKAQFYLRRKNLELLWPQSERAKMLFDTYVIECKCFSCTSNYPPYPRRLGEKSIDEFKIELDALPLLRTFNGAPNSVYLCDDIAVLKTMEKFAIRFLQNFERHHPMEKTLKMKFLLTQIWNYLYSKH